MKLTRPYDVVAPLSVFGVLQGLRRSDRRKIEDFLFRLARQPSLLGDFEAPTDEDRVHQVKIAGNWMVSYWIDDAVREVRLSGIEVIE